MAGFQLDRIRNIRTYIDVMTDTDFSYRDRNKDGDKDGDKIIYGKKYDDIKKANGFTSVALDLHDNTLAPVHSGFDLFTEEDLGKHDIKWYVKMDLDTSLDSAGTTGSIVSREQLPDRFGVVDKDGKKKNITWDEYQTEKRLMPLYLATAHGSQNPLPQAA